MKHLFKLSPLIIAAFLSGCVTTGATRLPTVSYAQAIAFENSLTAGVSPIPPKPSKLFTQPINKNDGCKLPTTQGQLDRSNFRAYWDGECRDGFAYGFGRDIAISDTHHNEEITIHNGTANDYSRALVDYDFLKNQVVYCSMGPQWPRMACLLERYHNSVEGFSLMRQVGVKNSQGWDFVFKHSPLNPVQTVMGSYANLVYRFTDYTSVPSSNPAAIAATIEVLDKRPGLSQQQATGFVIVKYRNGQVRYVKATRGALQPINLVPEYLSHLMDRYRFITSTLSNARSRIKKAKNLERGYVYKVCSGSRNIPGLDARTFRLVCTWREKFKEPFKAALAAYKAKLENMAKVARTESQRRQVLEYQRRQAEAAEAAVSALNWRNLQNSIERSTPTRCYTFYNTTTCY